MSRRGGFFSVTLIFSRPPCRTSSTQTTPWIGLISVTLLRHHRAFLEIRTLDSDDSEISFGLHILDARVFSFGDSSNGF